MQYGRIPGLKKDMSRLVQGMFVINTGDLDAGYSMLDAIYEMGCNAVDTAHGYGEKNEGTLGKWVLDRGLRDKVVIITKGAHPSDRNRVTPEDITTDLNESLRRMGTDYVDLYLLHRDDPSVPVGPIVESLNDHLSAGRIHAFGGSNWTHQRIAEANDYARAHQLTPFAVSSPNFSLAEQVNAPWDGCVSISGPRNKEACDWYTGEKMPLLPWSSLGGGFFSGRFRRDNLDEFQNGLDKLCVTSYCTEENFRRLDRANELAREKGVTVTQIAVAYLFNQPMNIFALVGCRKPQEFAQNVEALNVKLAPEEIAWLELKSDTR